MKFKPGVYYVGDPSFVLPAKNLRLIFGLILKNKRLCGREYVNNDVKVPYWIAPTPGISGTLYLADGTAYGYDWGGFGCVPWDKLECYDGVGNMHKFEFTEPFECSFTEDSITIGHLHFTFNPK